MPEGERMANWTFITNHGAVLLAISRKGRITAREIAVEIGITERSVMRIIGDLEYASYIERHREGRRNIYHINREVGLRKEITRDTAIGELLRVLNPGVY